LGQTFGTSAGTQTFKSVEQADVLLVIGANPSDAHPVFASRMKRRLREGAKLIVADPRKIDLVSSPHVKAQHHLALKPGTNVALITALAHVVVTEGLVDERFVTERCEPLAFAQWAEFVARPEHSPEAMELDTGVPAAVPLRVWPLSPAISNALERPKSPTLAIVLPSISCRKIL
jgi:formate dehydrogenase major subunit